MLVVDDDELVEDEDEEDDDEDEWGFDVVVIVCWAAKIRELRRTLMKINFVKLWDHS